VTATIAPATSSTSSRSRSDIATATGTRTNSSLYRMKPTALDATSVAVMVARANAARANANGSQPRRAVDRSPPSSRTARTATTQPAARSAMVIRPDDETSLSPLGRQISSTVAATTKLGRRTPASTAVSSQASGARATRTGPRTASAGRGRVSGTEAIAITPGGC
jgi:hypothetical protein